MITVTTADQLKAEVRGTLLSLRSSYVQLVPVAQAQVLSALIEVGFFFIAHYLASNVDTEELTEFIVSKLLTDQTELSDSQYIAAEKSLLTNAQSQTDLTSDISKAFSNVAQSQSEVTAVGIGKLFEDSYETLASQTSASVSKASQEASQTDDVLQSASIGKQLQAQADTKDGIQSASVEKALTELSEALASLQSLSLSKPIADGAATLDSQSATVQSVKADQATALDATNVSSFKSREDQADVSTEQLVSLNKASQDESQLVDQQVSTTSKVSTDGLSSVDDQYTSTSKAFAEYAESTDSQEAAVSKQQKDFSELLDTQAYALGKSVKDLVDAQDWLEATTQFNRAYIEQGFIDDGLGVEIHKSISESLAINAVIYIGQMYENNSSEELNGIGAFISLMELFKSITENTDALDLVGLSVSKPFTESAESSDSAFSSTNKAFTEIQELIESFTSTVSKILQETGDINDHVNISAVKNFGALALSVDQDFATAFVNKSSSEFLDLIEGFSGSFSKYLSELVNTDDLFSLQYQKSTTDASEIGFATTRETGKANSELIQSLDTINRSFAKNQTEKADVLDSGFIELMNYAEDGYFASNYSGLRIYF